MNKELEENHEIYFQKDLRGVNERYHFFVRDQIIPKTGGESALEIGCGAGDWTRLICQKYKRVDIVEPSASLIKNVLHICQKNKCQSVTGHHCTIESFRPPEGQKWQHIYMTFLLEHLEDPVGVLRRVTKLLRKNGRLYIAVPNANSVHRILAVRMKLIKAADELSRNDLRVCHHRVYTPKLLVSHILKAGCEIDKVIPLGLKFVNIDQMKKWPRQLIDVLCQSGDIAPQNCAYIGVIAKLKKSK